MDRALIPTLWTFSQDSDAATGPERKPMRAPIFIHDAVTPWGQETLLLKLLREQAADQDE
ncbi:hypothetical protein [Ruegeria sp. SCP11]|uniref:hypothetical protein n=1 Tax=Ruegeria sp. SCP11 TaxID=3141378 RepID=UPI003338000C